MNNPKRDRKLGREEPQKPRRPPKVVGPVPPDESPQGERPRARIRVVTTASGERLPARQRKQSLAQNLDRLLELVGMGRKEAAEQLGIPYRLVRRLVSAGVSKLDKGNEDSLKKLADHFALPDVEDLWRPGLVAWLLSSEEGRAFVDKFRQKLSEEFLLRLHAARASAVSDEDVANEYEELALLGRVLGFKERITPPLVGEYAQKAAAILASPEGDSFKRVISDYYEMVRPDAHDAARQAEQQQ